MALSKYLSSGLFGVLLMGLVDSCMMLYASEALLLEGIYNYSLFQGRGEPIYESKRRFRVYRSDCSWLVRHEEFLAEKRLAEVEPYIIVASDEELVYVVKPQNELLSRQNFGENFDSERDNVATSFAEIHKSAYPPPNLQTTRHLCIGLGLGCELNEASGHTKPLSIVDLAVFNHPDYQVGYEWRENPAEEFVRSLILTSDGSVVARLPDQSIIKGTSQNPYQNGYTNGIGRLKKLGRVDGISYPSEFEFTGYFPMHEGMVSSNDLLLSFTFSCVVTNSEVTSMPTLPPTLPQGVTIFQDRRFAEEGYSQLRYGTTNTWYETDSLELSTVKLGTDPTSFSQELRSSSWLGEKLDRKLVLAFVFFALCLVGVWQLRRGRANE